MILWRVSMPPLLWRVSLDQGGVTRHGDPSGSVPVSCPWGETPPRWSAPYLLAEGTALKKSKISGKVCRDMFS